MAASDERVQTAGVHHARLTVSDPARSREFYERIGFDLMMDFPDGVLVTNGTLFLGLRTAPDAGRAQAGDRFDPNRPGLDHLSFTVATRDDLDRAARICAAAGVPCGEVVDFGPSFGFYVLMLEDPDGLQIELTAPYVAS